MAEIRDRRSAGSSGKEETRSASNIEQGAQPSFRAREVSTGARSISEFFAPDKARRELTRGEWLNLMGMLEYQRKYSRWYWRIWRFLMGDPQVRSIIPNLIDAHDQTIKDMVGKMAAQQREAAKAAGIMHQVRKEAGDA